MTASAARVEKTRGCCACGEVKPFSAFGMTAPGKGDANNLRSRCRDCERAAARAYYRATPEKQRAKTAAQRDSGASRLAVRKSELKHRYGLTIEQAEQMLLARNYCCDICGEQRVGDLKRQLHIDHCHISGVVRGMLCSKCNHAIGLFQESEERMLSAIEYLRKTAWLK